MTELQILEKAIKQSGQEYPMKLSGVPFDHKTAMFSIIFSHKFARAFFGEEEIGAEDLNIDGQCWVCSYDALIFEAGVKKWQCHLQIMVLEENPIKHLEQYLK